MESGDREEDHEQDHELMREDVEDRAGAQPMTASKLLEHGVVVACRGNAEKSAGKVFHNGECNSVEDQDRYKCMDNDVGLVSRDQSSGQRAFWVSDDILRKRCVLVFTTSLEFGRIIAPEKSKETYCVNILQIVHDSECDQEESFDDQGPEEWTEREGF